MSHFGFADLQLFHGHWLAADKLPWHYILEYLAIKNVEIFVLILFVAIVFFSIRINLNSIRRPKEIDLVFIFCLLLPLCILFFGKSTLYNGWRHFYFLYPFLLIFIFRELNIKPFFPFVFILLVVLVVQQIRVVFIFYPYGHVHFNAFVSGQVDKKYEIDYWGLSVVDCLKYIEDTHKSLDTISVYTDEACGQGNQLVLDSLASNKIKFVPDIERSSFVIYQSRKEFKHSSYELLHTVRKQNISMYKIYQKVR